MTSKKRNDATKLIVYIITLLLLLLTSVNIHKIFKTEEVLGIETKMIEDEEKFWKDFLTQNPDYIPGWIEIGDYEKVKQIDPNYFLQP